MKKVTRWLIAIGATAGTFAIGLCVSGSVLLPIWVKSDADRWVIAAGFGVALAALAALWGINFAQSKDHETHDMSDKSYQAPRRMTAKASGKGRVYQAGRDQNIKER
jgi:hypothetical protein